MKKIKPKNLSQIELSILAGDQSRVDSIPTFEAQKAQIDSLWKNKKTTSVAKTAAFLQIEENLKNAITPNGYCHYCEHNEASEIEHISPKSYFPEQAFVWDNYLFVCGECNNNKLAHFYVFNPANSDSIQKLDSKPPTTDICFIQSRLDNPMDYLFLDLSTGIFIELPILEEATSVLEKRHRATAEQTRKILDLNREILRKSRQNVATHYKVQLEYAAKIANSKQTRTLEKMSSIFANCVTAKDFQENKKACLNLVKSNIQKHPYGNPTVWEEIKRQRSLYPNDLSAWFAACPDALTW